jgi:hypothetical protein
MVLDPHDKGRFLFGGNSLFQGDYLRNNRFYAKLDNGRFVLYEKLLGGNKILKVFFPFNYIDYITMELNGDLVFYFVAKYETYAPGSYLELTATGDLVIKDPLSGYPLVYLFQNSPGFSADIGSFHGLGASFGHASSAGFGSDYGQVLALEL